MNKEPCLVVVTAGRLSVLKFRPCDAKTSLEVLIGPEERLLDIVDAFDVPVAFGCRSGTCGTCRIEIESGGELLSPPDENEQWQIERLVGKNLRLACLARAKKLF